MPNQVTNTRIVLSGNRSILLNNLVAYWKMEGNSNNAVSSLTSTDTDITYSTANGKIAQGAGFNGTSSNIEVGTLSSFSFIQNTGIFSISTWIKVNNAGVLEYPFGSVPTSVEKGMYLAHNANGSVSIFAVIGDGVATTLINHTAASFFTDTNYHHLVVVGNKTANTVQFYKDGVAIGAAGTVGTLATGDSTRLLRLGQINNNATNFLNGSLDEFGVWSRALTSGEITKLYNAGSGLTYPF